MNFCINFHLLKSHIQMFFILIPKSWAPSCSGPALHKHLSERRGLQGSGPSPSSRGCPQMYQELPIPVLPTNCFLEQNSEVFSFAKSICPCDAASVSVLRLDKTLSLIHCQADLQMHWCEPTPVSQQCLNLGIQRSPQSAERLLCMSFHRAPGHMVGTN